MATLRELKERQRAAREAARKKAEAPAKGKKAPSAPGKKKKKKKNIPFAEIITGVIVVAILVGGSQNTVSQWLNTRNIDAGAENLYYALVWARESAVKNNKPTLIKFDQTSRVYTVYMDHNGNYKGDPNEEIRKEFLPEGVEFGTNSQIKVPGLWDGKPLGPDPIVFSAGKPPLMFNGQGAASDETAIYLVRSEDIRVRPDYMRAVSIAKTTGFVKVWKFVPGDPPHWE
jgi:hypothetical protein